jgi:predicted RNase H-like HicB family nuclease
MPTQELDRQRVVEKSPVPKPVVAFFAVLRKVLGGAEDERECIYEPPTQSHIGTWNLEISVIADELDGGFIAECANVPGAMSQGETKEEALENLIDAVQGIVAAQMEASFRDSAVESAPGTFRLSASH